MKKYILTLHFFVVLLNTSCAQTTDKTIVTPEKTGITADLYLRYTGVPWSFVFLPDQSILITERAGKLLHFKNGESKEIKNLPAIKTSGQGGLLDLILDPDYKNNGYLYFAYSSPEGTGNGSNTAIARAKLNNQELVEVKVLYKASPNSSTAHHFGSRLVIDGKRNLYFSVGDRGNRDKNPQDISRDGGKIYRITTNGGIPDDNPFVNSSKAKKAIYSYGHRNPQGLTFHPKTKELWSHEHGPRGGDEINIIQRGKNYGWPQITYGINYSGTKITDKTAQNGMEQPIHYWVPSIAPCDMLFVTGSIYPEWEGNLLVGSLAFQYLERLIFENNKVVRREKLLDGIGRVRSLTQDSDGFIYIGVENKGIYKLVPAKH
ncbi:PQQ-dependent sugar dehydrogenase [Croceivirga sp. JEA036]|uniref:PQQ-dependent sugar dehydrogenase n=1 Tax=Croceivirga sp. JEA036 TaxID=2721162 RepID=UPI001439F6B0|nr:PQQ-dependent sugar dehydrogenase [Croceivirga sp. JEA036]NJB37669.1 PQQ-dependent sugar dehydrogenase [Croceivirga sp. JEA036]